MKKRLPFLALAIFLALALAACGADAPPAPAMPAPAMPADAAPPPAAEEAAAEPAAPPPPMAEMPAEAEEDMIFASEPAIPDYGDTEYLQIPILTPEDAGDRRLIYSVSMELQTTEFMSGVNVVYTTIGESGGYMIHSHVQGRDLRNPGEEGIATFSFRVPTVRLSEFILTMEANFNILDLQQFMWEVTDTYRETAWTLEDLQDEEARLEAALENATGAAREDLLNRLNSTRHTIRVLQAAQAGIMDDVVFSFVDIQLFEVIIEEEQEPEPTPLFNTFEIILLVFLGLVLLLVIAIVVIFASKKRLLKAQLAATAGEGQNETDVKK